MNSLEQWRNTRRAGIRIGIIFIVLALALSCWSYAHSADLQIQILVSGKPAPNQEYTLDGDPVSVPARALLHGITDSDGMIHATGIATGTWTLYTGCLVESVEVGEVTGQVIQQVDAGCKAYLTGVRSEHP